MESVYGVLDEVDAGRAVGARKCYAETPRGGGGVRPSFAALRGNPGAPLWGAPKRVKKGFIDLFRAVLFWGCAGAHLGRPSRVKLRGPSR